jgi:hypothetical protein
MTAAINNSSMLMAAPLEQVDALNQVWKRRRKTNSGLHRL